MSTIRRLVPQGGLCHHVSLFVHRGIVKEMGLTGKITPDQVAKKWDNLKTKFKVTTSSSDLHTTV